MSLGTLDSASRKIGKMQARALVAAGVAAMLPLTAFAHSIRHVPTVLPHAVVPVARKLPVTTRGRFRPLKQGPHTFYGKIVNLLNGDTVMLQTRRNRLVNVDATNVLAAGTYSAPLFVGKLVTVDGNQPATGAFVASHISRLINLKNLNNDH
jgi:hypothetical protein